MSTYQTWLIRLSALPLAFALISAALVGAAPAQATKPPRIGFLGAASAAGYASQLEALHQGFRDVGYVEGQNHMIEYRWAEGRYERLPALAAELVRLSPDVIVTHGTPPTRALKDATTTIPIVMAVTGDPVAAGLITSLARPGGNITGSAFFGPEISVKRLELLKTAVPLVTRVAVLVNPNNPLHRVYPETMARAAAALNVELVEVPTRSPKEFDDAFARIDGLRANGLVVLDDAMLLANVRRVAKLAGARLLPGAGGADYAVAGGLLAYGVNYRVLWRRAPVFVDKILKGAKPATLPVEQATKFDLIINRKTADAMRLPIPQSLLLRTDRVIE